MDTKDLTIKKVRALLDKKEISPRELFDAYRGQIDEKDKELNAFISVFDYQRSEPTGEPDALRDIPYVLKDNIMVEGKKCTAASQILKDYKSTYDATVTKKLKEKGAVCLGKGNLDEFAMGSTGEHSSFGPTRNPHDTSRVAGGSSSGPVAAVAGDMALFGLGSETNGSICMPSGWCGLVGLKPTYGRVSRNGLLAFGSGLDQIGPITKTVEDVALVLETIAGYDPMDSTTSRDRVPHYIDELRKDIKGMKIAVPKEFFNDNLNSEVSEITKNAIKKLESLGANIEEVSLKTFEYALAAYYIIAPAEASANLARYDGIRYGHHTQKGDDLLDVYMKSRNEGFGAEVKRRIMIGTYALSAGYYDAYYAKAQKIRTLLIQELDDILKKYDAIVGPTNASVAPKIGATNDPLSFYLMDIYMTPQSLAGLPSITVPAGKIEVDGKALPVGVEITGKQFDETTILQLGYALEQSLL
jgi:aspartyl-tRNA(Asn)/glutamyl-tRNA(Gln) amidotransferase subunit A